MENKVLNNFCGLHAAHVVISEHNNKNCKKRDETKNDRNSS